MPTPASKTLTCGLLLASYLWACSIASLPMILCVGEDGHVELERPGSDCCAVTVAVCRDDHAHDHACLHACGEACQDIAVAALPCAVAGKKQVEELSFAPAQFVAYVTAAEMYPPSVARLHHVVSTANPPPALVLIRTVVLLV